MKTYLHKNNFHVTANLKKVTTGAAAINAVMLC